MYTCEMVVCVLADAAHAVVWKDVVLTERWTRVVIAIMADLYNRDMVD